MSSLEVPMNFEWAMSTIGMAIILVEQEYVSALFLFSRGENIDSDPMYMRMQHFETRHFSGYFFNTVVHQKYVTHKRFIHLLLWMF